MKKTTTLTEKISIPGGEEDRQVAVIDGLLPLPKGSTFVIPIGSGSECTYRVISDPKTVISPQSSKSARGGWVAIYLQVEQVFDPKWANIDSGDAPG